MPNSHSPKASEHRTAEDEILQAVRSLRFGAVEVVVHNGQIVQIEKKEKVRFVNGPETSQRK